MVLPCRAAKVAAIALALCAASPWHAGAQRGRRDGRSTFEPNVAYDGRFTFARIRYTVYGYRSGWEFDYPYMERHLMLMMEQVTALRPHVRASNIHAFDDPQLLKYPIAYLSEPGYWHMSDEEVLGLRRYLSKGGFLIVDDFRQNEWYNFEREIKRALPNYTIHRLDVSNKIFHSFFDLQTLDMDYPYQRGLKAEFFGIYEDNDPKKRLMVIINYNNDLGEYMEYSDVGWWPVNTSNDAYKFVINYLIYALTH